MTKFKWGRGNGARGRKIVHASNCVRIMKQNREVRKVHDEWNVGSVYSHLGESSIKFQTKYIGAVESITVPFFLEGVYI